MPRSNYEDDFDERGILKDGHTLRVKMTDGLTDLQKAIAADSAARRARDAAIDPVERAVAAAEAVARSERTGITDGNGVGGLNLHRPGFRMSAAVAHDRTADAYDAYARDVQNAFRGGSHPFGSGTPRRRRKRRVRTDAADHSYHRTAPSTSIRPKTKTIRSIRRSRISGELRRNLKRRTIENVGTMVSLGSVGIDPSMLQEPDEDDDEEFQDSRRRLDSAQLSQNHQLRMAKLYGEIEREKLNEWRNPPK